MFINKIQHEKIIIFISFYFCITNFSFGCNNNEFENLSTYTIDCVYDEQNHTLTCSQTLNYYNNTDNALNKLEFFLYANAFNEGNSVVSTSSFDKAYPNGASYGGIEVKGATCNDTDTEFVVEGDKTAF